MSKFSQGIRTTNTATGAALELIAGVSDRARLVEFGCMITAQTVTQIGLGYPAAKGVTPTLPVTFLSEDPGDSSACGITSALAWATAPTSPAYFYRRATLGLGLNGIVWTWPTGEGLLLLPSTSLVLWLFATGAVLDAWARFEQ